MAAKKAQSNKTPDPDTILAQFWNAFGCGAGRFIDPDCYTVFKDKGYLRNIKQRLPTFANPRVLERTLMCCLEAGQLAGLMAARTKRLTISGAMFLKAVEEVENRQAELIASSKKLQKMVEDRVYGGIC